MHHNIISPLASIGQIGEIGEEISDRLRYFGVAVPTPLFEVTSVRKVFVLLSLLATISLTTAASASILPEGFESGAFPGDWLITPTSGIAWDVGGSIGGSVSVSAAEGLFFARSGGPGDREADTGTARSNGYVVSFEKLEWQSTGWSGNGGSGDGFNYFEILNSSFQSLVTISPAQSDSWETASVNLLDYLSAGDTFYFQAVDKRANPNNNGYSWIAFDKLTFAGDQLEIPDGVPEATSFLIWGLLGLTIAVGGWKRRERE